MRFRSSRLMGVPILSLFLGLALGACSGSQQDQEGLEVETQQGQYAENEYAENEYGQQSNYGEAGEYADEDAYNYGGDGVEYAEFNETENDLQEIIQEMNGEGDAMAADPYGMGSQDMVYDDAGYNAAAPINTTPTQTMSTGSNMAGSPNVPFQPGGTPAGYGLPEIGSKMAYIVQPGDTLAQISRKVYGNINRWQEMADLSGMANPSRIYPGDIVYYTLEVASIPFATAYEQIQRSEEVVQAGDTLASIAQRVYGTSKGWKAIWRQNDKIDNPDQVTPGSVVYYISSSNLAQEIVKQKAHFAELKKEKFENTKMALEAKNEASDSFKAAGILLADGRSQHSYAQFLS